MDVCCIVFDIDETNVIFRKTILSHFMFSSLYATCITNIFRKENSKGGGV